MIFNDIQFSIFNDIQFSIFNDIQFSVQTADSPAYLFYKIVEGSGHEGPPTDGRA